MTAIIWVALQWLCSVLVLVLVSAVLAETSPAGPGTAAAAGGGTPPRFSAGKRAFELLLAALERLGVPVEWTREVVDGGGTAGENGGRGGVLRRFRSRKRCALPSKQQPEQERVRVSLEGASLSLNDVRVVDSKFACYKITVATSATGASAGARWEVWRRMADLIKLKAALSKVSAADVELPPLPHSYRRSFDASRLARRRRSIQHFLQVAVKQPALRDSDALLDFLSPEGRKSMHYMKNAVMTGTRRIARHVPMSMPNPKAIQRHIPIPKGVPKFPTKYNPYKRSSTRRSNNDFSEDAGGSMADIFSGAHLGNGNGNGGAGSVSAGRGGGDGEMDGLTWQAHDGIDDSGGISSSGGAGIGSSGGGETSSSGGGGASGLSPRRKSYLWKRPTAKTGGDGGGGGVQSYTSAGAILRPRPDAETVTVAPQETGGDGAAALLDGRPSVSGHADGGEARRAAGTVPGDVLHQGSGAADAAAAATAAAVAGSLENGGRNRVDLSGRAARSGDAGGGGGGGVELLAGVKDGGDGHRFRVRGASFLADGREVQAEPAVCPLVYAELFTFASADRPHEVPAATVAEEACASSGRVDHIATKGRCALKITELTARSGGHAGEDHAGGNDDVDKEGGISRLGPPFLVIFNFQIPGDPPLSLVAAWAVHPECLGPDSPESLRRFFGVFYRLVDIPLSSPRPSSGETRAGGGGAADREGGGAAVASPTASGSLAPSDSHLWETSDSDRDSSGDELEGVGGRGGGGGLKNGGDNNKIGNVSTGETPAGNQRSGTVKAAADGVPVQGDQRIKLAVSLLDGPQVVAEALPESGSSLLGHEASLRYFRGERYLEVDMDLASSSASSQVTSLCREHAKSLSLEVGLILHGESESELPESVLGVLRIDKLDPQDTTRHRLLWGS
ncbi:unnamed protein product [Ectocarpus sp. 6 AP-2014]